MKKVIEFLPYIIAGYETLSHAIPTKKNYSLFNKVGVVLQLLSGFLNRKRPYGSPKNPLLLFLLVPVFALFYSCAALKKIDCASTKTVQITYITKDGFSYTLNIPYCDTIRVKNIKQVGDSLTLK